MIWALFLDANDELVMSAGVSLVSGWRPVVKLQSPAASSESDDLVAEPTDEQPGASAGT